MAQALRESLRDSKRGTPAERLSGTSGARRPAGPEASGHAQPAEERSSTRAAEERSSMRDISLGTALDRGGTAIAWHSIA